MEQKIAVSLTLAQAFLDDPFYQAITVDIADPARKTAVLATYFELAIDEARHAGEVVLRGDHAAAVWITNEANAEAISMQKQIRQRAIAGLLGGAGLDNYRRILQSMEANVPPGLANAWYLSIIGVASSMRGQGIAHEMIQATLQRARRRGAACYLETFNPLSLPFYRRAGFDNAIQYVEQVTGRNCWLLFSSAS